MFTKVGNSSQAVNTWDQIFRTEESHRKLSSSLDIKSFKTPKVQS